MHAKLTFKTEASTRVIPRNQNVKGLIAAKWLKLRPTLVWGEVKVKDGWRLLCLGLVCGVEGFAGAEM